MSERKLVSVRSVGSVHPIPGADRIERARIDGWDVVVKKGEFKEGDPCVYFEIDSFLPIDDERFSFLASSNVRVLDGVNGHVLKTVRLRKQLSQGLALPIDLFEDQLGPSWMVGDDVTDVLGIKKWEKPIPPSLGGNVTGGFPTFGVRKTDSERVQNLTGVWGELVADEWYATEKIDGTSITIINDADNFRVCSRNWELTPSENSAYWQAARKYVQPYLAVDMYVQAELYGPGIQGNPLGVDELRLAVHTYGHFTGNLFTRKVWPKWVLDIAVPIYDDLSNGLPGSVDEVVEQVSGIESLVSPGVPAEGVVFHSKSGTVYEKLGGRPQFKVISNEYLLKTE